MNGTMDVIRVLLPGLGMGMLVPMGVLCLFFIHVRVGWLKGMALVVVVTAIWAPTFGKMFFEESRQTYERLGTEEPPALEPLTTDDWFVMNQAFDDKKFSSEEIEVFARASRHIGADVHGVLVRRELAPLSPVTERDYQALLDRVSDKTLYLSENGR